MKQRILRRLEESLSVKDRSVRRNLDRIVHGADLLSQCIASGHKILIFGNGGSAADAQHIAAELVNRFRIERPPLAAVALTTDSSVLTSIGNDYRFEEVFAKQVRALGRPGDVAWGISTSGNSPNVLEAMKAAGEMRMGRMGMSGRGGKLSDLAEILFTVESDVTARIQETHIFIAHVLCELVDDILFAGESAA